MSDINSPPIIRNIEIIVHDKNTEHKPYETKVEEHQKLHILFERWHKHHEHLVPLKELLWYYHPVATHPGNVGDGLIVVIEGDKTPIDYDFPDKVNIYVEHVKGDEPIKAKAKPTAPASA